MESKWNVPLGRWVGVPVFLHWSWVLLFLFILIKNPQFALVYAGVFFLVLLHECGHCLAAQRYHMPIHDIVLFPFGGAARMEISRKPIEEMIMALAGPAVNVVLIPVFMIIGPWNEILTLLGYYNIVLLVFNLVPAFPMDGGRVVRSALSHFMGDHERATLIAGRIGQVCAVGFVALAIYSGAWMLALIGVFVFLAAQREIMQSSQVNPQLASERDVKQSNDNVAEIQRRMADLDRRYRDS